MTGPCGVENCGAIGRLTRGMCQKHYTRLRRHGDVSHVENTARCSIEDCGAAHYALGFCLVHYGRLKKTGSTSAPPSAEDRFWAKVERGDTPRACWTWRGRLSPEGYGIIRRTRGAESAHRVAFALANGPIPPGMHVDHICHRRSCVNPSHLRLATPSENIEHHQGATRRSQTGVRGVSPYRGKWRVSVQGAGQLRRRIVDSLEEASELAVAWRNELQTRNDADRNCCDLHNVGTPCGEFDHCCQACPVLYEPRWNILHTGLVLASFVAGFGWWALT